MSHYIEKDSYTPYRYVIEAVLFLSYAAFGLSWAAAGSLLTNIMEDLSLSLSQASFVNTCVSFAKVLGPVLAGYISYRLGLRKAFLLSSALICLGVFAPLSYSYGFLLLARFGMGLGGALMVVYFTPIIMEWFPPKERAAANGINFISVSVGMMLGLHITFPILDYFNGSWRNVLILYGVINVLLCLCWLFLGRESWAGLKNNEKAGGDKGFGRYKEAVKDKNTWKLIFAYSGTLCHYMVLITYFPAFFKTSPQFAYEPAALQIPAVIMFCGIPAALLGIFFSNILGLRLPILFISGLLLAPSVLGTFLISYMSLLVLFAVTTGFGMFLWRSPFFTIPQELPGSTPEKAGSMMAIFWAVSYTIAALFVWFAGIITEIYGSFIPAFFLTAVLCLSLPLGTYFIPETGPNKVSCQKQEG